MDAGYSYVELREMNIPPVPLVPMPETLTAERAVGFKLAGEPIGKRHRIGGQPDWIQGEDIPRCACAKAMNFYGQLDSLGDEFSIGDCGMIYVFLCYDCLESKSVVQSY